MRIKTVFIDDNQDDLQKYKEKFEEDERTKNLFNIIPISENKIEKIKEEIKKENPDLLLMDFDLTKPIGDICIGISGVALSVELRESFQEIPIVLFTRKDVFNIETYPSRIKLVLDGIVYKSDVFIDNSKNINSLYELASGFKKLREVQSKDWINLIKTINAPNIDYEMLKLSNPPIAQDGKWSISEATNWLRNILFKYPGILYDPIHSATFLGITCDSFLDEAVQKFFTLAKYSEVFNPPEGRWWKSKLQEIAESIMNNEEKDLFTNEGFPLAWERKSKKQIERSKCIYRGESPAECVCYILKKPVKIKYSLSYKPDSRPSVMDEARVSFKAIRESNEVNDELFNSLGQEMLKDIRKI